ncbi:N-acetyl sugar amidotransferase [Candidatus Omnitrophota bacterium]
MIKRCAKCIMPETKPGIEFNQSGVCNACVNEESKNNIDWETRFKELRQIAEIVKDKKPNGYNCVIPVSGGKDSTFVSVLAKEKLGLRPLLVCVQPMNPTGIGRKNLDNLSSLGFDIFAFQPNKKIMPTLVKRTFYEDGKCGRAFEFMLYSVPMHVAINYKIPLAIWGENPRFEYGNAGGESLGASAAGRKKDTSFKNQDADHWISEGVGPEDLVAFQHPSEEEIRNAGVESVFMSYFLKFDSRKIAEFCVERGLSVRPKHELLGSGGYWDFEQLDDEGPVVSHLLKYLKYGYGRGTDHACRDIRWEYITRKEGLKLAQEYDGHCNPDYIKRFSDYIGIDSEEFWRVADGFRNQDIWKRVNGKWELALNYD